MSKRQGNERKQGKKEPGMRACGCVREGEEKEKKRGRCFIKKAWLSFSLAYSFY